MLSKEDNRFYEWLKSSVSPEKEAIALWPIAVIVAAVVLLAVGMARAEGFTDSQIADAIYKAEGGAKTIHPYGILTKYKTTTARQACINTIRHARRDFNGKGEFLAFLAGRYAPIGVANDPSGLNRNWLKNVKYFLGGLA